MSSMSATRARDAGDSAAQFEPSAIYAQAVDENFPVALRLLPKAARAHLIAIYGFARLVDDLGDEAEGDRLALLDAVETSFDHALTGEATDPILVRAADTARAIGATREPFIALIDANRQDQRVKRYETIAELEAYCALSANPVGRLVLLVFGVHEAAARARSDEICTGLQLIEHLQDVGEDYAAGRVYLPAEDLRTFGARESELGGASASPALRRVIAFECARARSYLDDGAPLVAMVKGSARLAIAGFVGGGRAQLDAIERQSFDVLVRPAKAGKAAVARSSARILLGAHR